MPLYSHTQAGTVMRWSMALSLLVVALVFCFVRAPQALPLGLLGVVGLVDAACLALFWSLTVEVSPAHLKFWFGPGLISKTLPLRSITGWEPVSGLLSWGIHWAPGRGWLYNVSGRRAVALTLDSGKRLMIGTDEPEALCRALGEAKALVRG